MTKWKVYISSTFRDLKEFRAELRSYFEKQLNANFELSKVMERMYDNGTYAPFAAECISEVQNCDIYILILGNKVGSFPPNETRTYTEIELDTAINTGRKIFCFRLAQFNESEIDNKTKHQEVLNKFQGKPIHIFSDIDSLKLSFLEILIQFASSSSINITNPYKGLAPYHVTDGNNFFGRDHEIEECIKKIIVNQDNPFISVIGNSGIGKTSFVQAGVLYSLKSDSKYGFKDFLQIIVTPGPEPFSNLRYQFHINGIDLEELTSTLELKQNIILFFNQFEEIITQCHSENSEAERVLLFKFLDSITALKSANKKLIIISTFRSDYLSPLANFDFIKNRQTYFPLNSLDYNLNTTSWEASIKEIITKPAMVHGVEIEHELTKQLTNEIKEVDGSLSILQFALQQLWTETTIKDRIITSAEYSDLTKGKGIAGIIETHAQTVVDKILKEYNYIKDTEAILKTIFLNLVEVTDSNWDVRKTINKADLFERLTLYPTQPTKDIFEYLTGEKSRLLTVTETKDKIINVDIIHEVLIRKWGKLKDWVNEKRIALRYQKRIEVEAKDGTVGFFRGRRLKEAINWSKNNPELVTESIRKFINNSTKNRNVRKRLTIFIPLSILVLFLLAYKPYKKWNFKNEIKRNTSLNSQYIEAGGDFDSVKTLTIDDNNYLLLTGNLSYFKNLKDISIDNAEFPDLSILAGTESLTHLNIVSDSLLSLKGSEMQPSLTHLTISTCSKIQNLEGLEKFNGLDSLIIMRSIGPKTLTGIEKLDSLKYLFLFQNKNLNEISALNQLKSINSLRIVGDTILFNLRAINNSNAIKELDISFDTQTSSQKYDQFQLLAEPIFYFQNLRGFKSLKSLRISGFFLPRLFNLYTRHLRMNLKGIEQLDSLTSLHIKGVNDPSNYNWLVPLKKLKFLSIEDNDSLINLKMLANLKFITSLNLSANKNLISLNGIERIEQLDTLSVTADKSFDISNVYSLKKLKKLSLSKDIEVDLVKLKKNNPAIKVIIY